MNDAYPQHDISFRPARLGSDLRILVFGRGPDHRTYNGSFVFTYSIAQIMSKANAASVLAAALRQFVMEPDPIPFTEPQWSFNAGNVRGMDFSKPTAIDIETDGLLGETHTPEEINIISVAFYQEGKAPLVITGQWDADDGRTKTFRPEEYATLRELLPKFEYAIYHNGKFDIRVMNRFFGITLVNSFDTMLAHHVLNIAAGDHKLKTCARRYLGAPEWEEDLGKYTKGGGHYELIPTPVLARYNGWDVYWTFKLWEFFAPQIASDDNNVMAFQLEMAAANFLLSVEQYGIPFDDSYASEYSRTLGSVMELKLLRLRRILVDKHMHKGDTFNPNSPMQVKQALATFGFYPANTKEETLIKLQEQSRDEGFTQFIDTLIEFRKASKTKGTYADGWKSKSRMGRVHPTFLVHGTSTGRLSSTGPNAQNVPRDKTVRKLVTITDRFGAGFKQSVYEYGAVGNRNAEGR